jgi:uncharacterized membrane protein
MGQRNTTAWERIGRARYNAIADGRADIAVFLNVLMLYMEKKATREQLEAERDRLLELTSRQTIDILLYTLQLPKHIEKIISI